MEPKYIHYHVHKSLPFDLMMCQRNQSTSLDPITSKSISDLLQIIYMELGQLSQYRDGLDGLGSIPSSARFLSSPHGPD
jgi:hypothetical protein